MKDLAVYSGETFNNPDTTAKYRSFESLSTNPVDIGLPATITKKEEFEATDLIARGVAHLHDSHDEKDGECEIIILLGSEIVASIYTGILHLPFDKYIKKIMVSESLGNNILIFDRNAVSIHIDSLYHTMIDTEKSNEEFKHYTACASVPSISISDPKKSLFYRDVLVL